MRVSESGMNLQVKLENLRATRVPSVKQTSSAGQQKQIELLVAGGDLLHIECLGHAPASCQ